MVKGTAITATEGNWSQDAGSAPWLDLGSCPIGLLHEHTTFVVIQRSGTVPELLLQRQTTSARSVAVRRVSKNFCFSPLSVYFGIQISSDWKYLNYIENVCCSVDFTSSDTVVFWRCSLQSIAVFGGCSFSWFFSTHLLSFSVHARGRQWLPQPLLAFCSSFPNAWSGGDSASLGGLSIGLDASTHPCGWGNFKEREFQNDLITRNRYSQFSLPTVIFCRITSDLGLIKKLLVGQILY